MLTSPDLMVASMKWAGISGDIKVSSRFEMSSNSLTAQNQALGALRGWGNTEEELSQQYGHKSHTGTEGP